MNEWGNAIIVLQQGNSIFSCGQEPVLFGVQVDVHWT